MIEIMENKLITILYMIQLALFFFALIALATDGIMQVVVIIAGIGFSILGFINIFFMWVEKEKYAWIFILCTVVQFVIFILVVKPMFHETAMFFYLNPWIIEALAISLFAGLVAGAIRKTYIAHHNVYNSYVELWAFVTFCIFLIGFVIVLVALSAYPNCYLAQTLDVSEIDELPDMDMDYLRITPMKVADRYATDACQYPRHTPSKPSDITMINGTPYWAYLLVPDSFVNVYNIKPQGAVFIDMTTTEKDLEIMEYTFEIAPDLALTDDIYWKIHELNYWADCERTMVVLHESELYLAVPYIEYDLHFSFPMLYRAPKWGGVFLVDKDGNIEDLSPKEAQENLILQGQKLFPEKLVLTYIDSQRFWKAKNGDFIGGITNTWFDHIDEIEVTDVSDQGNSQPFLINTKEGLKWFVSCEPHGTSHGIYRIYLLDARTGLIEMKQYSGDEIGPVKACNYARTDNPLVDWSRFQVIEPIPVTPNGELYWEVRVVPDDGSGISYTSFVNPKTGRVTECKTDVQILQFMHGKTVNKTDDDEVSGLISDVDIFIQDGNTRWVFEINGTYYIARAEDFTLSTLTTIVNLEVGDSISIKFVEGNIIIEMKL